MRSAPLDPCQPLAVRAQRWRRVEISTFGQHLARAGRQINRHQAMSILLLFDRQHPASGELQIAVAAVSRRQRDRLAIQRLPIHLLIRFIDENHPVRRQTKRTTAIFVHAATHAETVRRQTFRCAIAPMPDSARGVLGAVFVPEHTMGAELQFGEVDPGGDGLGGAERLSPWR